MTATDYLEMAQRERQTRDLFFLKVENRMLRLLVKAHPKYAAFRSQRRRVGSLMTQVEALFVVGQTMDLDGLCALLPGANRMRLNYALIGLEKAGRLHRVKIGVYQRMIQL